MSNHSNETEAHAFFYNGVNNGAKKSYSGCTLSYDGNRAFSYSTCIAKVIPQRGFDADAVRTENENSGLTMISFFPMSSTTGRHIGQVRSASPFPVVEVPVTRGSDDICPRYMRELFLKHLEYYSQNVNNKDSRDKFIRLMDSRSTIIRMAGHLWAEPLMSKAFDKFDALDVEKYALELKERNRRIAAKKSAEARAVIKKYMGAKRGPAYIEFVRAAFDSVYFSTRFPFTKDERKIVRERLTSGGAAYVWVDGDEIVTSRCVRVPANEAGLLLKLWARGADMRTMKIGQYSVISYTGPSIKIGCHNIPRENMIALYETVVGKPFPAANGEVKA